jgi:dihydrolipoamide dehydrogenase
VVNNQVQAIIENRQTASQTIGQTASQTIGQTTIIAEKMIIAAGITANTENLGLEKTKIKLDRGHIVTNAYGETDEPGVYAIGDVAGPPWLAHKASHEAIMCVDHIAKQPSHAGIDRFSIPSCTYSLPQIASVGMTEAQAIAAGKKIKVGRFPYMANGKAVAMNEKEGLRQFLMQKPASC